MVNRSRLDTKSPKEVAIDEVCKKLVQLGIPFSRCSSYHVKIVGKVNYYSSGKIHLDNKPSLQETGEEVLWEVLKDMGVMF